MLKYLIYFTHWWWVRDFHYADSFTTVFFIFFLLFFSLILLSSNVSYSFFLVKLHGMLMSSNHSLSYSSSLFPCLSLPPSLSLSFTVLCTQPQTTGYVSAYCKSSTKDTAPQVLAFCCYRRLALIPKEQCVFILETLTDPLA